MNVMGINLKSNRLRIVSLSGDKNNHARIEESFHQLEFPKSNDIDQIHIIRETILAFIHRNNIEAISINGRAATGPKSGGGLTFKTEGFLLGITPVPIQNIFTATVNATNRKQQELKTNQPKTKDLAKAYDLAFEALQ